MSIVFQCYTMSHLYVFITVFIDALALWWILWSSPGFLIMPKKKKMLLWTLSILSSDAQVQGVLRNGTVGSCGQLLCAFTNRCPLFSSFWFPRRFHPFYYPTCSRHGFLLLHIDQHFVLLGFFFLILQIWYDEVVFHLDLILISLTTNDTKHLLHTYWSVSFPLMRNAFHQVFCACFKILLIVFLLTQEKYVYVLDTSLVSYRFLNIIFHVYISFHSYIFSWTEVNNFNLVKIY